MRPLRVPRHALHRAVHRDRGALTRARLGLPPAQHDMVCLWGSDGEGHTSWLLPCIALSRLDRRVFLHGSRLAQLVVHTHTHTLYLPVPALNLQGCNAKSVQPTSPVGAVLHNHQLGRGKQGQCTHRWAQSISAMPGPKSRTATQPRVVVRTGGVCTSTWGWWHLRGITIEEESPGGTCAANQRARP